MSYYRLGLTEWGVTTDWGKLRMFQTVTDDPFRPEEPEFLPLPRGPLASQVQCLEQLLAAFSDLADFDDIHQAAQRLALVQAWIRTEAIAAAADPVFSD